MVKLPDLLPVDVNKLPVSLDTNSAALRNPIPWYIDGTTNTFKPGEVPTPSNNNPFLHSSMKVIPNRHYYAFLRGANITSFERTMSRQGVTNQATYNNVYLHGANILLRDPPDLIKQEMLNLHATRQAMNGTQYTYITTYLQSTHHFAAKTINSPLNLPTFLTEQVQPAAPIANSDNYTSHSIDTPLVPYNDYPYQLAYSTSNNQNTFMLRITQPIEILIPSIFEEGVSQYHYRISFNYAAPANLPTYVHDTIKGLGIWCKNVEVMIIGTKGAIGTQGMMLRNHHNVLFGPGSNNNPKRSGTSYGEMKVIAIALDTGHNIPITVIEGGAHIISGPSTTVPHINDIKYYNPPTTSKTQLQAKEFTLHPIYIRPIDYHNPLCKAEILIVIGNKAFTGTDVKEEYLETTLGEMPYIPAVHDFSALCGFLMVKHADHDMTDCIIVHAGQGYSSQHFPTLAIPKPAADGISTLNNEHIENTGIPASDGLQYINEDTNSYSNVCINSTGKEKILQISYSFDDADFTITPINFTKTPQELAQIKTNIRLALLTTVSYSFAYNNVAHTKLSLDFDLNTLATLLDTTILTPQGSINPHFIMDSDIECLLRLKNLSGDIHSTVVGNSSDCIGYSFDKQHHYMPTTPQMTAMRFDPATHSGHLEFTVSQPSGVQFIYTANGAQANLNQTAFDQLSSSIFSSSGSLNQLMGGLINQLTSAQWIQFFPSDFFATPNNDQGLINSLINIYQLNNLPINRTAIAKIVHYKMSALNAMSILFPDSLTPYGGQDFKDPIVHPNVQSLNWQNNYSVITNWYIRAYYR